MTTKRGSQRKWDGLVIAGALCLGLLLGEVGLRVWERIASARFDALSPLFGENFFFHHWRSGEKLFPSAAKFDALLGWHAGPSESPGSAGFHFNADGWRSPFDYRVEKSRTRIALIGDSYTFGSNLADSETIAARLQSLLGPSFEVLSFAAEGFAVDQMAVVATRKLPAYRPDAVIVSFIADDLRRSCLPFAWGQALKPYFVPRGEGVELRGVPVLSPTENAARHQRFGPRLEDGLLTQLLRSRVLNLLAQPVMEYRERFCVSELSARLLREVQRQWGERVFFVHLDGTLPLEFEQALKRKAVVVRSYRDAEPALAIREQGPKPGTSDGYHPDAARARLIAKFYEELLRGSSLLASQF